MTVRGSVTKGYGYDSSSTQSGAWTNRYLTNGLAPRIKENVDLGQLYEDAKNVYVQQYRQRGDRPCFFGRMNGGVAFNTEEGSAVAPPKMFMSADWL